VTERPNDVIALDAKTGKVFWLLPLHAVARCARLLRREQRGVAMLGQTLYMGTLDAHLVAIDARNGRPLWNVAVGDPKSGYSVTMAPLAVKDKIIVGVGGGEYGIRGFVAAYDAATARKPGASTPFPGPGEKGHETWSEEDWKTGGASAWVTGIIRSPAQSHLLGRRQSGPGLESGSTPRRQSLFRFSRGAGCGTPVS